MSIGKKLGTQVLALVIMFLTFWAHAANSPVYKADVAGSLLTPDKGADRNARRA